jgi:hypothetical protein
MNHVFDRHGDDKVSIGDILERGRMNDSRKRRGERGDLE